MELCKVVDSETNEKKKKRGIHNTHYSSKVRKQKTQNLLSKRHKINLCIVIDCTPPENIDSLPLNV